MAIGFAQAGADVLVNYSTDEEGARQTAAIIEEHGGNLRLTETTSKGCTFEITLPV